MCILNKKPQLGILKYIGTTHFADGEWCGILLDEACGKNDGSVKGVRYFRCKNKHGIFVHSHKVKAADDITLSRLNLLESPCSPQSAEKKDRTGVKSGQSMSSSDVENFRGDHMAFKHSDVKSLRLTKRNRSVSLDRYLFLKAKQLTKGFNILLHNAEKDGKINTWDQNRLNRCRSLPKITKENLCDSNEYHLSSEMAPLEKNVCLGERISNGGGQKVDLCYDPTNVAGVLSSAEGGISNLGKENQQTFSENSISVNSLNRPDGFHTSPNTTNGGTTAVHKVGHAVSLDTHLMIEKGQLTISNGNDDEISSVSHLANKKDPFIQGRHCSCPSLHCADHFSESITTCLDLGRTERSVIPEAEDDYKLESVNSQETQHKPLGYSHSQSETLGKIFPKPEVVRSKSSCSREAELTRAGSWPWLTSSPKQSLRRYSSSSNIDKCGAFGGSGDYEDVFNDGLTTLFTPIKPVSHVIAQRCVDVKNVDSVPQAGVDLTVKKAGKSLLTESHTADADSNYADSLSGSQASLSSTGTSESKGKKASTTKRVSGSVKSSSGAKSRAIPIRNNSAAKPPQLKQSRLDQMHQQQNCRVSSSSSTGNKPQQPKTTTVSVVGNSEVKMQKRHTLGTLPDVKSFVPRLSISKQPMSGGISEQPAKDKVKSSNLPVKKMATPSQISKPPTLPKLEKKSETASIPRRHSSAASRPPVTPVVKRDSGLVRSDSKARKTSKPAAIPAKASTGKEKETSVVGQKVVGGQNPAAIKGPKGSAAASGAKPQTSRVARSSSSVRGNGQFSCVMIINNLYRCPKKLMGQPKLEKVIIYGVELV